MRWDGHSSPHYEVWYTTMNQLTSGAGFWIRYAILSPRRGESHVQVWFTSFVPDLTHANVAVAQIYPIDQLSSQSETFSIRMGPCSLEAGRMTGMVDASGTPVTWDLVYEPVTDPLDNLPAILYKVPWVHTKLRTPHPFMMLGGKIQIGDHSFILNHDPGQQGHAWGSRHADEWIWFHCSSFVQEGGDPVAGYVTGIMARKRVLAGLVPLSLNFGHLVWNEKHWIIHAETPWAKRWNGVWEWKADAGDEDGSVRLTLPWKQMVLAEYQDPIGHPVYCHHTERADCVVEFRAPRQPPRVFRSMGMAHLEIGSRTPDSRVERKVSFQK